MRSTTRNANGKSAPQRTCVGCVLIAALVGVAACDEAGKKTQTRTYVLTPETPATLVGNQGAPGAPAPGSSPTQVPPLQSISRFVFVQMRAAAQQCPVPSAGGKTTLTYLMDVGVGGGKIIRAEVVGAGLAGGQGNPQPLPREAWPKALLDYVGCLRPQIMGMKVFPAVPDDTYQTVFTLPGTASAASGNP